MKEPQITDYLGVPHVVVNEKATKVVLFRGKDQFTFTLPDSPEKKCWACIADAKDVLSDSEHTCNKPEDNSHTDFTDKLMAATRQGMPKTSKEDGYLMITPEDYKGIVFNFNCQPEVSHAKDTASAFTSSKFTVPSTSGSGTVVIPLDKDFKEKKIAEFREQFPESWDDRGAKILFGSHEEAEQFLRSALEEMEIRQDGWWEANMEEAKKAGRLAMKEEVEKEIIRLGFEIGQIAQGGVCNEGCHNAGKFTQKQAILAAIRDMK